MGPPSVIIRHAYEATHLDRNLVPPNICMRSEWRTGSLRIDGMLDSHKTASCDGASLNKDTACGAVVMC